MIRLIRLNQKRQGAALAWMLMAFTVLMIIMTSVAFLTNQNTLEIVKQEERLQTYYIALSGVELTHAALMNKEKFEEASNKLKNNPDDSLTDEIEIKINDDTVGVAEVSIDRVFFDKKNWLQITSIGQLSEKNTKVTSTIRINESNTNQVVREKFAY